LKRLDLFAKSLSDDSLEEITCPHCSRNFIGTCTKQEPGSISVKEVTCIYCGKNFFT
jgi:hypothetical protein